MAPVGCTAPPSTPRVPPRVTAPSPVQRPKLPLPSMVERSCSARRLGERHAGAAQGLPGAERDGAVVQERPAAEEPGAATTGGHREETVVGERVTAQLEVRVPAAGRRELDRPGVGDVAAQRDRGVHRVRALHDERLAGGDVAVQGDPTARGDGRRTGARVVHGAAGDEDRVARRRPVPLRVRARSRPARRCPTSSPIPTRS